MPDISKKNMYNFFLLNADDCSISLAILSNPTVRTIRKHVASAASGIITEFVRKSKKSRLAIPKNWMKSNAPYPIEDNVPITIITTAIKIQHLGLLQCNSSWKVDTLVSKSEIALVAAARSTNTKNRIPAILPTPILANTFGSVMNIKDGPACRSSGLPPENANTAGMIISPASIAIAVSKISTCVVDFSRSTSLPI